MCFNSPLPVAFNVPYSTDKRKKLWCDIWHHSNTMLITRLCCCLSQSGLLFNLNCHWPFTVYNTPTMFRATRAGIGLGSETDQYVELLAAIWYGETFDRLTVCVVCFHSEVSNVVIDVSLLTTVTSDFLCIMIPSTCLTGSQMVIIILWKIIAD